jgi:dihydrofolate reductase
MRKLILQMQLSVDGFVAGPAGQLDWMTWDIDDQLKSFINELHEDVDLILLGRKMSEGFTSHWENMLPDNPDNWLAKKMVDTPKIIFTKTLDKAVGKNTSLAKGNLVDEITKLKKQDGKDIIVYGGASFVASLIEENLIDEYNLFINPAAIGEGMRIFSGETKLRLITSQQYECGVVVNTYQPIKFNKKDNHNIGKELLETI